MHSTLSSQLKTLKLSDAVRQSIAPLTIILDAITRAAEEDEGDPLTSTIEALRDMQVTVAQFGNTTTGGGTSEDNSESSSEYTTPAQSQATSPSHDQSPPPPGFAVQMAHVTVSTAAQLMTLQTSGGAGGSGGGETSQQHHSPNTSPTHCENVSSLATHSQTVHTQQDRGAAGVTVRPNDPRKKSKSNPEMQRHRVRPASQQLPSKNADQSRHIHSCSIGCSIK